MTKLDCVERPVTEVQRVFDPSILEGQVTSSTDIQEFKVTVSNSLLRASAMQRSILSIG